MEYPPAHTGSLRQTKVNICAHNFYFKWCPILYLMQFMIGHSRASISQEVIESIENVIKLVALAVYKLNNQGTSLIYPQPSDKRSSTEIMSYPGLESW